MAIGNKRINRYIAAADAIWRFNFSRGSEMRRYWFVLTLSTLSTFAQAATTHIQCTKDAQGVSWGQSVKLDCSADIKVLAKSVDIRTTTKNAWCTNNFSGQRLSMKFESGGNTLRAPDRTQWGDDFYYVKMEPEARITLPRRMVSLGKWDCRMFVRLSIYYTPFITSPAASPSGGTPTCGGQGCSKRRR